MTPTARLRTAVLLCALLLLAACGGGGGDRDAGAPAATTRPLPASLAAANGWLAYQSGSSRGGGGVFLVRANGSDDHEILTDLPSQHLHPDFSRDGKRLAYDSEANVYVAGADGTDPRLIANCDPNAGCMQHWEPAWSPDGKRLAISTAAGMGDPPKRFGIAIVDLATQTVRPVVDHASRAGQDHFPRWSPDGRKLVFWRGREHPGGAQAAVFVVNADGTGPRQLTPWKLLGGDPDWSPDGSLIVFNTRPLVDFPDAGQSELCTIRPDGTGLRRLTAYGPNGPRATQPRWTPDGKAILYTRTTQTGSPRHIYAINADGTADVPVLTAKPIYTHPILQPTP
jgi:TolB protein